MTHVSGVSENECKVNIRHLLASDRFNCMVVTCFLNSFHISFLSVSQMRWAFMFIADVSWSFDRNSFVS